jgi:hypothetical protein
MHKYLLIVIALITVPLVSFSQSNTNSNIIGQGDLSDGLWVISQDNLRQIEGTPYLFDTWYQTGKIYFSDKVYTLNAFNYNIQAERFEAKISEDSVFALNHGSFNKVEIKGRTFSRHLDPDYQRNTYFEDVVHFKDKQLLKKYILKIKEGQINPMTMQKIQHDQYIKKEQYYILNDNTNQIDKIKLKKSTILSLVEEAKKASVKAYAKENRLSFKNNDDVFKILNYYNSL